MTVLYSFLFVRNVESFVDFNVDFDFDKRKEGWTSGQTNVTNTFRYINKSQPQLAVAVVVKKVLIFMMTEHLTFLSKLKIADHYVILVCAEVSFKNFLCFKSETMV